MSLLCSSSSIAVVVNWRDGIGEFNARAGLLRGQQCMCVYIQWKIELGRQGMCF